MKETRIDWQFPQPQSGVAGAWERFMGPGLTAAEGWLTLAATLLGLAAWVGIVWLGEAALNGWQTAVGGLIMFDLAGGLVANATSTTKRWYHRPGQSRKDHLGFILPHLLHIGAVAWFFQSGSWLYALGWGTLLLGLSGAILLFPLYLQRPAAFASYAAVLLLHATWLPSVPALSWFIPFLFLKLHLGHLLQEEPYRPSSTTEGK